MTTSIIYPAAALTAYKLRSVTNYKIDINVK
jgi:hypothetical protein